MTPDPLALPLGSSTPARSTQTLVVEAVPPCDSFAGPAAPATLPDRHPRGWSRFLGPGPRNGGSTVLVIHSHGDALECGGPTLLSFFRVGLSDHAWGDRRKN